jgi:DNA-directed RNA polymerase sigma subunit (sigma70/sigma32)
MPTVAYFYGIAGRQFSVSREHIHQIGAKALRKLNTRGGSGVVQRLFASGQIA